MKKKLIPILLAVLLLFTACTPGNSGRGKELGYFNCPGLEWGMTEEEFFKVIGVSADDFTVETDDSALIRKYTQGNVDFLGKKADQVTWGFQKLTDEGRYFLHNVTAVYAGEIDTNERIEKLNAMAKEQEIAVDESTERIRFEGDQSVNVFDDDALYAEGADVIWIKYTMDSKATGADLPEEFYEKVKAGYMELSLAGDFDSYASYPLSGASVWYIRDMKTGDATLTLTLSARIAEFYALAE